MSNNILTESDKLRQRRLLGDYLICGKKDVVERTLTHLVELSENLDTPIDRMSSDNYNRFLSSRCTKKFYNEKKSYCVMFLKYCGFEEKAAEVLELKYNFDNKREFYISFKQVWGYITCKINEMYIKEEIVDLHRYDSNKLLVGLVAIGIPAAEVSDIKTADVDFTNGKILVNGKEYLIPYPELLEFITQYKSLDGYKSVRGEITYDQTEYLLKRASYKNGQTNMVTLKRTLTMQLSRVFDILVNDVEKSYNCWEFLMRYGINVNDEQAMLKLDWEGEWNKIIAKLNTDQKRFIGRLNLSYFYRLCREHYKPINEENE